MPSALLKRGNISSMRDLDSLTGGFQFMLVLILEYLMILLQDLKLLSDLIMKIFMARDIPVMSLELLETATITLIPFLRSQRGGIFMPEYLWDIIHGLCQPITPALILPDLDSALRLEAGTSSTRSLDLILSSAEAVPSRVGRSALHTP